MGEKVLTKRQKEVLRAVFSEPKLQHYYLSGGTALSAFYFQHRLSEDLDFFASKNVNTRFLAAFIQKLKKSLRAKELSFEKLYDRRIFVLKWPNKKELKIEFSLYPFQQFKKPAVKNGVKVDSLRDISANKLAALLDRFDPKDFVDLFFILKDRGIQSLAGDVEKKFGLNVDPIFLGGELAKAHRIKALPTMLKSLEVEKLKDFFSKIALKLKPKIF